MCWGTHRYVFPVKFWKKTSASGYEFKVTSLWWSPIESVVLRDGRGIHISPSARCRIRVDGTSIPILVDCKNFPDESELLTKLAATFRRGERKTLYLDIYKIYERLSISKKIEYSAIRHAVAHDPRSLTKVKVVDQLESDFGTAGIDLSIYKHQVKFWIRLSEMLIEIDELLFEKIRPIIDVSKTPEEYVLDW